MNLAPTNIILQQTPWFLTFLKVVATFCIGNIPWHTSYRYTERIASFWRNRNKQTYALGLHMTYGKPIGVFHSRLFYNWILPVAVIKESQATPNWSLVVLIAALWILEYKHQQTLYKAKSENFSQNGTTKMHSFDFKLQLDKVRGRYTGMSQYSGRAAEIMTPRSPRDVCRPQRLNWVSTLCRGVSDDKRHHKGYCQYITQRKHQQ